MPVFSLHGVANFSWFVWKTNVNIVQSLLCTERYLKTVSLLLGNYFLYNLSDCRYKFLCPVALAPLTSTKCIIRYFGEVWEVADGREAKMHCCYFSMLVFVFKGKPNDSWWCSMMQFNFGWSRRQRILVPIAYFCTICEYSRSSAVFQNACWCFYSLVELMERVEILFIVYCWKLFQVIIVLDSMPCNDNHVFCDFFLSRANFLKFFIIVHRLQNSIMLAW